MQRRPGEERWLKLCVCLQAQSEQICHVLKSQVSSCFSLYRVEVGEEEEDGEEEEEEEGGWTFGEVNPRRINSTAWSRYASGSQRRVENQCSSLRPSGREEVLQREGRTSIAYSWSIIHFVAVWRFRWRHKCTMWQKHWLKCTVYAQLEKRSTIKTLGCCWMIPGKTWKLDFEFQIKTLIWVLKKDQTQYTNEKKVF